MDSSTFFSTLLGVIAGGVITWFFSYFYNIKAGNELKEESSRLRRKSDMLIPSVSAVLC